MSFLHNLSGLDTDALKSCDDKTRTIAGLSGIIVLLFSVFVGISTYSFTAFTTEYLPIRLFAAVVMGFIMFNGYRFVFSDVTWMRPNSEIAKPAAYVSIFRIILVATITFLFCKPFEFLLLRDRISNNIVKEQQKNFKDLENEINAYFIQLTAFNQAELAKIENEKQLLQIEITECKQQLTSTKGFELDKWKDKLNIAQQHYKECCNRTDERVKKLNEQIALYEISKNNQLKLASAGVLGRQSFLLCMNVMHRDCAICWLLTLACVVFFTTPIILRSFFNHFGNYEYENAKADLIQSIILQHYQSFLLEYNHQMNRWVPGYQKKHLYDDPPFNSVRTKTPWDDKTKGTLFDLLNTDNLTAKDVHNAQTPPPDDAPGHVFS